MWNPYIKLLNFAELPSACISKQLSNFARRISTSDYYTHFVLLDYKIDEDASISGSKFSLT